MTTMKALALVAILANPVRLGDVEVTGLDWQDAPTSRQKSVWREVARCSGQRGVSPDDVRWATAERIERLDGSLLYGAAVGVAALGDDAVIVIERDVRSNPAVVGHEILHTLGFGHSDPEMARCTPPSPVSLKKRTA